MVEVVASEEVENEVDVLYAGTLEVVEEREAVEMNLVCGYMEVEVAEVEVTVVFCTTYCTTALGEEREVVERWRIWNNDKVGKAEWVGVKKWEFRCTLPYIAEVEVEKAEKTGNFLHTNMPKEV